MSQTTFKELNLPTGIDRAIDELGFESATEIQGRSIPLIRTGRDVIGRSQTGTGKTIAFGIPAIEVVDPKLSSFSVQVLILCPTRELSMQAAEEFKKLARYSDGIHVAEVYGGAPMNLQIMKLKKANIVIGTPGRVMDHLRRKTMRLHALKMVVLDEADEMLSMGFREDIETILRGTPEDRQTILFSATMPDEILALTKEFQINPEIVAVNHKQITIDNIKQLYYQVPSRKKQEALNLLLQFHAPKRALIFVNTKSMADEITLTLNRNGYQAQGLHGDMRQVQRTKTMDDFKAGRIAILVATDVAARGIDVNDIDYVINYDIPQNSEYYVHRIGRTGRAGKAGSAITLCEGGRQVQALLFLGKRTKSSIERLEFPASESIQKIQNTMKSTEIEAVITEGAFNYETVVADLLEKGYDEKQIALAVLELHFGAPKKFEEMRAEPQVHPQRRIEREFNAEQGDRIRIGVGRRQKVAPNHIVAAIAEVTDLHGKDIGKIDVFNDYTLVSVPEDKMDSTLRSLKNFTVCGIQLSATAYSALPPNKAFRKKGIQDKGFSRGH